MTRDEFRDGMKSLRVLRGWPTDEDAQQERLAAFWEHFEHADGAAFARGCQRAGRTRTFFPTPAELFADCEAAAPRDTWIAERPYREAPTEIKYLPNPFGGDGIRVRVYLGEESGKTCDECNDTGWSSAWCGPHKRQPWLRTVACGREGDHPAHEWVCQCGCWHTNARLIAKRARQAQHARGGKTAEGAA